MNLFNKIKLAWTIRFRPKAALRPGTADGATVPPNDVAYRAVIGILLPGKNWTIFHGDALGAYNYGAIAARLRNGEIWDFVDNKWRL